jgi:hypothetical protein
VFLGIHSIEDDGDVREEFRDNVEGTYGRRALVRSSPDVRQFCQQRDKKRH